MITYINKRNFPIIAVGVLTASLWQFISYPQKLKKEKKKKTYGLI